MFTFLDSHHPLGSNILFTFNFCFVAFAVVKGQSPTLQARNAAGTRISSPGSVAEGSSVTLTCTFTIPQGISNAAVQLQVRNSSDPSWTNQIVCSPLSGDVDKIKAISPIGEPVFLAKADASCSNSQFSVEAVLQKDWPTRYNCRYFDETSSKFHDYNITLRTHTLPTKPSVTKSPNTKGAFKENDVVNFTCSSMARPPPMLKFSYGSTEVTDAVQSPNTTNEDDPSAVTTLTWSTPVNKDMNNKTLQCSVYGHPSKSNIAHGILLAVFYGPENIDTRTVNWNLMDSDTKIVDCGFSSHGSLTYTWYNKTISDGNMLPGRSATFSLSASAYSFVTKDEGVVENLICKGVNPNNDNKSATSPISLVIRTSGTPPNTAAPVKGTTDAGGLPDYGIGLIVGGCVLLIVVVVVVVALVLRARQSPAAWKKRAANDGGGVGYISNNGSSQPDVVRNSYVAPDVPRSPQQFNRHSQNVEDYADAIDDKPRSRRPIAYSMDELNDSFDGHPDGTLGGGPPAYYPYESLQRGYPAQPDFSSYGAAC